MNEFSCGLCGKKAHGSNDGVAPRYLTLDDEEEFYFLICQTCVICLREKHEVFERLWEEDQEQTRIRMQKEYEELLKDEEFVRELNLSLTWKARIKIWIMRHITHRPGTGKNQ